MDKIKLKPRARQADSFNGRKAPSVLGSYHIGAWDIVSSENPASVSLYHPRFEDIALTGSEAQEVFSEVSAIAQANGCSAEDAWRRFLSRYLVLDSAQGKESSSHRAFAKMLRMQRHAMDSVDDSAKVYTTRFHDLEQAFATGIPAGYEFLGTGVAFMPNTHKRVHTVDFRNTNLDEDAEGATIEVPYDANTGTIAKVKEDLANMVAAVSAKTSDAAPRTRTAHNRPVPTKLQDSGDSPVADYDDVLAIFTAKRLSGFTYHEDGRIFVDLSTNAAKALGLTDLPYNLQVTFEAEGVEDDSSSVENKWWDRESVPVASVDVSLMKRADALSHESDESLCGWYIPAGQPITRADVATIADAFRQVIDAAPQTIELVSALLRSALHSFKFYEDASAVSSKRSADAVGLDPSAVLGAYAEEGYAGSFENAIDLFAGQGLSLTRKGDTLVHRGQVSFAGGTAQVDVRLYGKRSDASGSRRDTHVTSMSLLASVISAPEFPKGWVIARFENSYHPSTMPRAIQVLASRVSRLLKSSFETEDALATALERCFWGKAAPVITDEQRRQAKEFAESIFGRGVKDSAAGAGSHKVKDGHSQLSYAAMADAFDKYGISYELVDHTLWASTPLWEDPASGTKYILTFCVEPTLSEPEADTLYDTVGLESYYDQMEAANIDLVIERADAGPGGPDPVSRYPDAFSPVALSSFLNYFNGKRGYLSHLGSLEKVGVELSVMIGEFK